MRQSEAVDEVASPVVAKPATARFAFLPELAQFSVVLMWASTFILTKDLLDHFSPLSYIFTRFLFITAICFAVLVFRGQRDGWHKYWHIDRADWLLFIASGLSGYTIYQLGFTFGLKHTSPFSSSLLISMMPLFSLVIVTVMGERPVLSAWLGVAIAIAGVVVFLADGSGESGWLGDILSLMASLSFAVYGIISRPLVRKYPMETFSAFATLAGTIPLMIAGLPDAIDQDWGAMPTSAWWSMAYMAVLPVYVAYMIWNWAIGVRGVSATSWSLLVPIVSGILSAVIYQEAFGPLKIIGAALALLGLVCMRFGALGWRRLRMRGKVAI